MAALTSARFVFDTSADPQLVVGTSVTDFLFGAFGADQLSGGSGNDRLAAAAGADILIGGTGNDALFGGTGDDVFRYDARGFGLDVIGDFGTGDRIDLRGMRIGDLATLMPYMVQVGDDVVITTVFAGATERITIENTTIATLTSARFIFDTGRDSLVVNGTSSQDTLFGAIGSDQLIGGLGNDQLSGGAGRDVLIGGAGSDTLSGGAAADIFRYDARGFGEDTIADFGVGDAIDLRALGIGDLATLQLVMNQVGDDVVIASAYGGADETIVIQNTSIGSLTAAQFRFDTTGDALFVNGTSSTDFLFGASGSDRIDGGAGNDTIFGGRGVDTLVGGAGTDTLTGGADGDVFAYTVRGFGTDTITDFGTDDRIDVRGYGIGDLATLSAVMTQVGDDVVINTLFGGGIEQITIEDVAIASLTAARFLFDTSAEPLFVTGTSSNDTLFGGLGNDRVNGSAGNDRLFGGVGNDILIGSGGGDVLIGGAGADIFRYAATDASASVPDTILDFNGAADDRIDLRPIDPDTAFGDQALTFVTGAFTAVGQVAITSSGSFFKISVNLDANFATAELVIDVTSSAALTPGDVLL